MNLMKCLILLLLVYEVVSEHKKKKHNKKCHKRRKCSKRHKEVPCVEEVICEEEVPYVEEVHHLSEKHDDESTNPWHKENLFISAEKDFAVFQQFFKPNVGKHPDHFRNDHPKEFIEEHEDIQTFLKQLLNKFFKTLFEKHFNHNLDKELIKHPLIDHLDDDCKNSLKLLIGKCFESVENKDCFTKLLELPLKDVFDEENMNHIHNLFDDHENKEYILDYLLELPLNAVLSHKIKEHIFEKDLGNHEDILENLLKLPLTDIFEFKEHLVFNTLFDKKLPEDIHSDEDKDDLLKFLVGTSIVKKEIEEDISKNVLKTLMNKLLIAKKLLIEQEKIKILKELIAHSVEAHIKDQIKRDEQLAVKALLVKLGEDILIKSIVKETIERSVKDHIKYDEQFAVKALLTKLMGEDILINSILKDTVEHSKIDEKHIEENDKEHEVKEKLLKLMILLSHQNKPEAVLINSVLKETVEHSQINEKLFPKYIEENDKDHSDKQEKLLKLIILLSHQNKPEEVLPVQKETVEHSQIEERDKEKLLKLMILLSHQNNPEEAPVQKEETNPPNSLKTNDDMELDFDNLKKQLQKLVITEQAKPAESNIQSVKPVENRYIIDIPASPEESCIIDIPANPVESYIIGTQPEYMKDIDKYEDPGIWDYYYDQYAHFIDEESDDDICIGGIDGKENVYYTYEQ